MIVLSCNNIVKTYGIDKILDNISFVINDGEKIGLVGVNGAGKSTLFNIISGNTPYDSGEIFISKNLKVGHLKQNTSMISDKSVFNEVLEVFNSLINMENKLRDLEHAISIESNNGKSNKLNELMIEYAQLTEEFSNNNGYGYKSEIKGVLKGLGFNEQQFDQPVKQLSGGQKARLSLAKLLLEKPDILLLDEPTNHLDIDAINWLERYICEYKGAVIIISHDRYFLDNIVSKIFFLENHKLNIYKGNYSTFMKKRKQELKLLNKKYEEQQKEIFRQEQIIKSLSSGGKRSIRQAKSRQKMLDKMKIVDKPAQINTKAKIKFEPKIISGNDVLEVNNLKKSFDSFTLFENINFKIYKGEKVGLIGPNGIGKSTLFKILLGKENKTDGEIKIGHHVNIAYYDQEQSDLNPENTVVDEIWNDNPKLDHNSIRTLLSQFLFFGDDIFKEVGDLSGGEKSRLSLLKLMLSKANLLLMDEPTNHLDIDSKEVLEDALLNYTGTLIVISHDRYFLNKVTDKILELSSEGLTEYLGNYDYYLEKKNALKLLDTDDEKEEKTKTQQKAERKKEREQRKKEKQKKEEIKKLEDEISKKEEEILSIEKLLCDSKIYSDPGKIQEISVKSNNLKNELEILYKKWIHLTEETNL